MLLLMSRVILIFFCIELFLKCDKSLDWDFKKICSINFEITLVISASYARNTAFEQNVRKDTSTGDWSHMLTKNVE